MMKAWKPALGDVVQLLNGSPKMTIERILEASYTTKDIACVWFKGGDVVRDNFYAATLKKTKEAK